MLQSKSQESFNSIIILNEELCHLFNEQNISQLEKKIPEYTEKIEKYFLMQKTHDLTKTELDELQQLILKHEKMTNLISEEKIKISKNLKQLHDGKKMQNVYP